MSVAPAMGLPQMVLTVPHIFMPASLHFRIARSHSFQYCGRVQPELAKWCSSSVETIISRRSGPTPFLRSSIARSTAGSRMVTAVMRDLVEVHAPLGAALPETVAAQVGQHLFRVRELRHEEGVPEVGDLDVFAAGQDHLFGVEHLGAGGDELLEMLKAVADGDVADRDLARHAGEDLPVVVLGHDVLPPFE